MAVTTTKPESKTKPAKVSVMSVAIINRAALLDALAVVGAIVPSRAHQPVLQCVRLVTGENNEARIEATNLQSFIRIPLPIAQVESQADLLIKHDELLRVVRASQGETLSIRVADNAAHVIGADSTHVMQLVDEGTMPQPAKVEGKRFAVSGADLVRMFKQTEHAQGDGVSNSFGMHGFNLVLDSGRVIVKGFDGGTLAVASASCESATDKIGAIVPDASAKIIEHIVTSDDSQVEIALADNLAFFSCDGAEFTCCLLEGGLAPELGLDKTAADYVQIEVAREEFLSAVQRASVFADGLTGLSVALSGHGATLAMNTKQNRADVNYPLKYKGEPQTIFIGADRLEGALRAARGDSVFIEVLSPTKPIIVRESGEYYCAIQPRNGV